MIRGGWVGVGAFFCVFGVSNVVVLGDRPKRHSPGPSKVVVLGGAPTPTPPPFGGGEDFTEKVTFGETLCTFHDETFTQK